MSERFNDKTPVILSLCQWKTPRKKRAEYSVTLDDTWSEMRSDALGRKVFYYQVLNERSGAEYVAELFEGVEGEPVGNCNCPAKQSTEATVCVHLVFCLVDLLEREPTFGECESLSPFMVGARTQ